MTSYDGLETSLEGSRPYELYRFSIGSQEFLFTSDPVDRTVDATVYVSSPLSRSAIAQGAEERNRVLKIRAPADNPFVALYRGESPSSVAAVSIFRLQRDEVPAAATKILQFKGEVEQVLFLDHADEAEIVCRSIESGAGLIVPRFDFGALCGNVLFGPIEPNGHGCGVDPIPHKVIGLCTAVSDDGLQITVSGCGAKPTNHFRSGFCNALGSGDRRLILAHSGDVLTLNRKFNISPLSAQVECFSGGDRSYHGCCTFYENWPQFGGWKDVPTKNPFATGLD